MESLKSIFKFHTTNEKLISAFQLKFEQLEQMEHPKQKLQYLNNKNYKDIMESTRKSLKFKMGGGKFFMFFIYLSEKHKNTLKNCSEHTAN